MEALAKTISLEPAKSRYPGLFSFVGETDGQYDNYGEFIYDVDFSKLSGDSKYSSLSSRSINSYRLMISDYHWMEKYFAKCTYYKAIIKNGEVSWAELDKYSAEENYNASLINSDLRTKLFQLGWDCHTVIYLESLDDATVTMARNDSIIAVSTDATYNYDAFISKGGITFFQFMEEGIGRIPVPETIEGIDVPNYVYVTQINDLISDMGKIKVNPGCNKNKYNEMGGDAFVTFLSQFTGTYLIQEKSYFSALASQSTSGYRLPLLLTLNYQDMGIARVAAQTWIPGYRYKEGDQVFYNSSSYTCIKDIEDEDLLTFTSEYWKNDAASAVTWTAITYSAESEVEDLRSTRRSYDDEGNEFFGIIEFSASNSTYTPISQVAFPYKTNVIRDKFVCTSEDGLSADTYGNTIYSITKDSSAMTYTFKYVIGGLLKDTDDGQVYDEDSHTGILYEETYDYVVSAFSATVESQDVNFTEDVIDFDSYRVPVDSMGNMAILSIAKHYIDDLKSISKYEGQNMTYSCIYRDETDFGLSDKKVWKTSVEVDRSSNAAFEQHFKLMEVNTFEDLENYGNNYFNIAEE